MRWQTITVGPDLPQFKISTDDRDFLHGNPRAFEPMKRHLRRRYDGDKPPRLS
jgi:hypothetical protein